MVANPRLYSYADLLEMPDDGKRREIIGGELIVSPAPIADHQRVLLNLILLLSRFATDSRSGELFVAPFDVVFGPNDVVEPDLLFIASERGRVPGKQNKFEGPPDLVVEIISPSSRRTDFVRKMALYARAGVQEYWIADPENQTLIVHALRADSYVVIESGVGGTITSERFPELRVDPREVFAVLDLDGCQRS
jgi:Uma2 family endonuclease